MKLHLGCGKRWIPGYVHIDIVPGDHIDHVCDVSSLSMIQNDSCTLVYASHVLQYFDHKEAINVLQEWRRVLRVGGKCRVSVPNFDMLAKAKQFGLSMNWLLGSLYGRLETNGELIYHKTCFDSASLEDAFYEAGFRHWDTWDWQDVEHKDVDDFSQAYFPHMEKERGLLWNLNMEATK